MRDHSECEVERQVKPKVQLQREVWQALVARGQEQGDGVCLSVYMWVFPGFWELRGGFYQPWRKGLEPEPMLVLEVLEEKLCLEWKG